MTVRLTPLPDGTLSLEFDSNTHEALKLAIRETYGPFETERDINRAAIRFGGELFTYQNDWADRCLIAGTDKGGQMLRRLYDILV